jgi:hypothetical protein
MTYGFGNLGTGTKCGRFQPVYAFINLNPRNRVKNGLYIGDLRGSDRMVVGFTTTYAISANHH